MGGMGGQSDESRELAAWMAGGEQEAGFAASGPLRLFSPTQLGLPRLTSPALGSMPPGWQEILSSSMPALEDPRRWRPRVTEADDSALLSAMQPAMPPAPRRPRSRVPQDDWGGQSQEWAALQPHASGDARGMPQWDGSNRPPREDDPTLDPPNRRRRSPRGRGSRALVRRLVLLLILLSVFDLGAVVVARPDLCPISACTSISHKVHQAIPFLGGTPTKTPPAISAVPSSVQIAVQAQKTASAPLSLANLTNASLAWQVTGGLPWLDVSPASGTLGVGSSASLTVTATATRIQPGPYSTTVTVTSNATAGGTLTIPVSITVTAGAPATSTPTAFWRGAGGAARGQAVAAPSANRARALVASS
jgi:hypothetical protein